MPRHNVRKSIRNFEDTLFVFIKEMVNLEEQGAASSVRIELINDQPGIW